MNDIYDLGNEQWKVEDDAQQCKVCETMEFIFSNRFGPWCCIGCADNLASQMKLLRGEVVHV